jgi:predicted transcriptional regulator/DNA-binding XRE family transcriptional regulator
MGTQKGPRLGARVKALRRREGLTQAKLAQQLEISASYLNLIEHNRRPLTAPLLIKLAQQFSLDLQTFAPDQDARLIPELVEALGDRLFEEHDLTPTDVRELVQGSPEAARAMLTLYRAWRAASLEHSAGQGGDAARRPQPAEEVSALIQARGNHFPALEEAAEHLWSSARLQGDLLQRSLAAHLEKAHGVQLHITNSRVDPGVTRRYDPKAKTLRLSALLAPHSRTFQLAHQIGLLECPSVMEHILKGAALTAPASVALARVALANYFAAAVVMPYTRFLEAAQEERYDIELLGHRFRASFEQVSHRLTSLGRPGQQGIPFHLVRVDIAGNISKRFSASGVELPRRGGACPRWGLFAAFQTPGLIRPQVSQMTDGRYYLCVSRTLHRHRGGYLAPRSTQAIAIGCALERASELVYADRLDLDDLEAATPVGVTCRLCERRGCAQRAAPWRGEPPRVDENLRGPSPYAGADEPERGG